MTAYLSGVECPTTRRLRATGALGLMLNPAAHLRHDGYAFAVDNGCYQPARPEWAVDADRVAAWLCWVGTLPRARALFVVAPDVYPSAEQTWAWGDHWLETIRWLGFHVALVAQDGAESFTAMWDEEQRWDWLFIGGTTEWKESTDALDCAREAQLLGKNVHVGRVNTLRRWNRWVAAGADSADGTMLRFGERHNGAILERMLASRTPQPDLFGSLPRNFWCERTLADWSGLPERKP